MGKLIVTTFKRKHEEGMCEVIKKAFANPGANAYPLPPPQLVILALKDNQVVGHISLRPMLFHLGEKLAKGNVLHMVATDPEYQHQGIGLRMLDKVIEISETLGFVVSLLETPVPQFYALRGWVPVGKRYEIMIEKNLLEDLEVTNESMVKLEDSNYDHVKEYIELRERIGAQKYFYVHTNDAYFHKILERYDNGSLVNFFHEITINGVFSGYVYGSRTMQVKEGTPLVIHIYELLIEDPITNQILAILNELLTFDDEFTRVLVKKPEMESIEDILVEMGGIKVMSKGNIDMARIIDPVLPDAKQINEDGKVHVKYVNSFFQAYLKEMEIE